MLTCILNLGDWYWFLIEITVTLYTLRFVKVFIKVLLTDSLTTQFSTSPRWTSYVVHDPPPKRWLNYADCAIFELYAAITHGIG